MKKFYTKLFITIIITICSILCFIPLFNNINYGLDLKGGFEVLYQVNPLSGDKLTSDMLSSTYKTIQKRIDVLGVSEPEITIEGSNRIRIRLAGVKDQDTARDILSKTASLTFRDSSDKLLMTSDVLSNTYVSSDSNTASPVVALNIKDSDTFYEVTKDISNTSDKLIVIWLDFEEGVDSFEKEKANCGTTNDSKCLSYATVSQGFAGNVIIQGKFKLEEAKNLSELINSGAMTTKLTEISSKTVGASFGENSLNKTFIAGLIGIIIVMSFMIYLYGFAGIISSIGIIIYTFLTFIIFYLIGGVLTLPGIAALILGIGMSVDANVISFERMKEELINGRSLKEAFDESYKHSLLTIFDANITTLVAALVMFFLGESSVKGFATMLIISIFLTIIVIVYGTKYLLKIFIDTKYFNDKKHKFITIRDKKKKVKKVIDFLKYKNIAYITSTIILLLGFTLFFTRGLNLGIDYKGGSSITIVSKEKINMSDIRKDIDTFDLKINDIDNINENSIYVKVEDILDKNEIKNISNHFDEKYNANTEIGVVSDMVKKELTVNAVIAVILSCLGIIIYVAFRFHFSYGISSVIAVFHDALMVIAVFSILSLEVNVIFIAAILAIIGYSINDTIVIFDRIRENENNLYKKGLKDKKEFYDLINLSVNETMKRTIYTSTTTVIVVIILILFGSFEIFNFNIAMFIGLISGTYSTVFIACALLYKFENKNIGKEKKKKEYKNEIDEPKVKGVNC